MVSFNMSTIAPFAKLTALLTFIASIPFASATFSVARCCTLAVRTEFQKYYAEHFPWEVCNLNKEIDYSTNETFPSIMKPMSWAKQFCRGTQYSNLRQWLQPLAAYISPYIGLLLLCPIGEEDPDKNAQSTPLGGSLLPALKVGMEYLSILGDPASAVFGAATEVYSDTAALYSISSLPPKIRSARWVAALAGALKFSSKTDWRSVADPEPNHVAPESSRPEAKGGETTTRTDEVNISPFRHGGNTAPNDDADMKTTTTEDEKEREKEEETTRAITLCIVARTPFASAILIPVVLMLAVTAATFYDAYAKKGDKDTGLALAYCVWYSWVLVPAVVGNCFATALSPEVARRAFSKVMNFGEGQGVVVALRDRHVNNRFWGNWLRRQEDNGKGLDGFVDEVRKDVRFWVLFGAGQLMGWCCVAVATGAATAIAWMTPTVGLGCRSFNFILYGILALMNAILHVVCSWFSLRSGGGRDESGQGVVGGVVFAKLTLADCVRGFYWFLVFGNSLVMVLGTLFHMVGVFRTCWCDRLTWNDDTMIELNSKTAEAVENANSYWISTAYVVFSIMTLVCVLAVVFRQIISRRMDEWMEAEEEKQRRDN